MPPATDLNTSQGLARGAPEPPLRRHPLRRAQRSVARAEQNLDPAQFVVDPGTEGTLEYQSSRATSRTVRSESIHADQRRTSKRSGRIDQHQTVSLDPRGLQVQVQRQPRRTVPARLRWLLLAVTGWPGCCVIHPRICQDSRTHKDPRPLNSVSMKSDSVA